MSEEKKQSHVYDVYNGEYVVLQFREPFLAVTAPGVLAQQAVTVETPEGPKKVPQPVTTQVLPGECHILKDDYGNVKVRMKYNDPRSDSDALVQTDFDPDDIFSISVVKEKSKISME